MVLKETKEKKCFICFISIFLKECHPAVDYFNDILKISITLFYVKYFILIWTDIFKVEQEFGITSQTYNVLSEVRLSEIEMFFKLWFRSSFKLIFISLTLYICIFIYIRSPTLTYTLDGRALSPWNVTNATPAVFFKNSVTKRLVLADS